MKRLWIILVHTTCLSIRSVMPQFNFGQYFQMPPMSGMGSFPGIPGFPGMASSMAGIPSMPSMPGILPMSAISSLFPSSSLGSNSDDEVSASGRRSGHHHKNKLRKKYSNEQDYDESSDVSGECKCSCNKCDNPKPCCIPFCEQCNMIGVTPGNVMLVPYAYPVFLTHPDKKQTTQLPGDTNTTEKESKNNETTYNKNVKFLRTIIKKVEHEETNEPDNNELDEVDKRLLKIIRMVQSEAHEAQITLSAVETTTTTTELTTIPTTTTNTPTTITTTPATTTTTTTPVTTTTITIPTTTSPTTTNSPTTTITSTKIRLKPTSITTITPTTPESEEITTTTTKAKVTPESRVRKTSSNQPYDDMLYKATHQGNKHSKYILTSMRRMKENFLPKYGVVPIPDDVAEKLINKIRSLRSGSAKTRAMMPETFKIPKTSHRHNIPLNTGLGHYQDPSDSLRYQVDHVETL